MTLCGDQHDKEAGLLDGLLLDSGSGGSWAEPTTCDQEAQDHALGGSLGKMIHAWLSVAGHSPDLQEQAEKPGRANCCLVLLSPLLANQKCQSAPHLERTCPALLLRQLLRILRALLL